LEIVEGEFSCHACWCNWGESDAGGPRTLGTAIIGRSPTAARTSPDVMPPLVG
jgi:hypothetical protein